MADKLSPLIRTALSRAAAAADAVPLFGSKTLDGLFPSNAAGKQAAQRCQEDGYLRLVSDDDSVPPLAQPSPPRGGEGGVRGGGAVTLVKKKTTRAPLCAITEKGWAFLLGQVSPRQVLEDFVRVLEGRRKQADDLLHSARQTQQSLEALKENVEKVLQHVYRSEGASERGGASSNLKTLLAGFREEAEPPSVKSASSETSTALQETVLAELTRWQHTSASEDCPLPYLYHQLTVRSIGSFHDVLRQLHDLDKIYLHPWTGPLYDIPEPPYALLIGHEIAYYASIRK